MDVVLGDRPLEGFDCCRHRALQRHRLDASRPAPLPAEDVRLTLQVTGSEIHDRGLFLDRIDLALRAGAQLWLQGTARYRPAPVAALDCVRE